MSTEPSRDEAVMSAGDPSTMTVEELQRLLQTDPAGGLSVPEVARRLDTYGPNELQAATAIPTWRRLLAQFQDPLVYLLIGAVAISLVAWIVEGGGGLPIDATVIAVIIVLNAVLGYVQEARAEDAVAALQKMTAVVATVIRDGAQTVVEVRDLVPGDLLVLAEGDSVGADARLLSAHALTVSEASLTGESQGVLKDESTLPQPAPLAERLDMVFSGTAVVQGSGRALVTATGMATEMGRIAQLLHDTEAEATPLQREISRVGRILGIAVIAIAVVVMGTLFVAGGGVENVQEAVDILLLGVSLAVAAVPEGLPAILSVVLAIGVRRLAAHQAIVRNLSSVETLGSASVIGSDKTGTLTKNEMTIARVVTASGETTVTGVGYRPDGQVMHNSSELTEGPVWEEVVRVLGGGSLANDAVLERDADGRWGIQGDPTEAAFLVAERKVGIHAARSERFTRVDEVPFTSERKLMSSIESDRELPGVLAVVTKGAPDVLIARCNRVQIGGEITDLDDERRRHFLAAVDRLSGEAFRTLAVAYKRLAEEPDSVDAGIEHGLILAGVVGIIDPARPEAAVAIADAHRAGIRIIMITGDHPLTAARIAVDLGIAQPGEPVLTGADLDLLDPAELTRAVRSTSVYARVAPQHKLLIVDALQADGNVVAMTGDGVNDAPALKSADIGIAMGRTGTEVTKQAAAMILADDNMATIVRAVRQGRAIFDNIKKFLRYLLSSNTGEVLTVFLGIVLAGVIGLGESGSGPVLPLLATQILWINLLTDSAPALAMGIDPEIDDVMARPPRPLTERVIDTQMWIGVAIIGFVMAAVTLLTIDIYLPGGLVDGTQSLDNARTAGFTVLVLAQLFNAFNARSEESSAFHRLFVNPWLWAAVALSAVLQVVVVHLPFLNTAFGTTALSWDQWLVCLAMASIVLWSSELRKLLATVIRRGSSTRGSGRTSDTSQ